MAIKIKLDNKDPKKHSVKFSTDKDGAAISSIYITNDAVSKLGDPDAVTITIAGD